MLKLLFLRKSNKEIMWEASTSTMYHEWKSNLIQFLIKDGNNSLTLLKKCNDPIFVCWIITCCIEMDLSGYSDLKMYNTPLCMFMWQAFHMWKSMEWICIMDRKFPILRMISCSSARDIIVKISYRIRLVWDQTDTNEKG